MSLLSPSSRPTKFLEPSSPKTNNAIILLVTPAITHSLYLASTFRALFSNIFLVTLLKTTLAYDYVRFMTLALCRPTSHGAILLARQLKLAVKTLWKRTEKPRDRLFFEFMVFVLGGGNGIVLFLFWPGWILVGLALLVMWTVGG